jgi:hypothetical protein
MKLLMEQWKKYLTEIGDLSIDPYPFESYGEDDPDGDVYYTFNAKSNGPKPIRYDVTFADGAPDAGNPHFRPWLVDYTANYETDVTTEENEPLKIMSTIVATIKDFIGRPELNQGKLKFAFEGIPKGDENPKDKRQTSRTKMYLKFLEKNLPSDFEIRLPNPEGNVVFFGKKDKAAHETS